MGNCALLSYSSAVVGLLAALVWLIAAFVRLRNVPTQQFTGVSNAGVNYLIKKLRCQGYLNAAAAVLTAIAVGLQAASTYCSAAHGCQ